MTTNSFEPIECRLCGGEAHPAFRKTVLRRHDVGYFRCSVCGSIETEAPYWLDEAYAIPGVHIDVGVASRTVKNWMALETLLSLAEVSRDARILDFGSASGLLARLMRDVGYDARSYDKYATPMFTSYFNADLSDAPRPDIVTAFEVFEHFDKAAEELTTLLSLRPELVVFTTWFCDGQGEDWIYFVPDCGQHIFFYTEKALADFVAALGYDLVLTSFFHLLIRRDAGEGVRRAATLFQQDAMTLVYERARPLFEMIAFGNPAIDADFDAAQRLFQTDLDKRGV